MQSPKVGKPRVASGMFSLSRKLPRLAVLSAPPSSAQRPRPQVNRVRRTLTDVLARNRGK